jgi:hypothetical protein
VSRDLFDQLAEYGEHIRAAQHPIELSELDRTRCAPASQPVNGRAITVLDRAEQVTSARGRWLKGSAAAATLAVLVAGLALVRSADDPSDERSTPVTSADPLRSVIPSDALDDAVVGPDGAAPTAETPLPDFDEVVLADSGNPPEVLTSVDELPNSDRLDFLQTDCGDGSCFRDARFVDADDRPYLAGEWTAGKPFHIRHGFPNDSGQPLGEGFDLAVYVYPLELESGGLDREPLGPTRRYTTDAIVRTETDACGPTYQSQAGPVMCEWFVHDFPDGLPAGRWAIWAVWEAPCAAWVDLGLADGCTDVNEVMSHFSSGFDSPFYSPDSGPMPSAPDAVEVVNPLVALRSMLTDRANDELFRVNADALAHWRITTLPDYDGRAFSLPPGPLERLDQAADEGDSDPDGDGSRTIRQQVQILSLDGQLVPAADGPVEATGTSNGEPIELRLNSDTMSLLASDELEPGDLFTIVSAVPELDADRLRAATVSNPPDAIYMQLPDDIPVAVSELAAEVTVNAATSYDAALALQNWFRSEFQYSIEVQSGHSTVALAAFLDERVGYAEQFAASFAVMTRTLGIPSRIAVGFTPGVLDEDGWYQVTGANAHAWPEIWFDDIGWVPFEPTPGRGASGIHTGT